MDYIGEQRHHENVRKIKVILTGIAILLIAQMYFDRVNTNSMVAAIRGTDIVANADYSKPPKKKNKQ